MTTDSNSQTFLIRKWLFNCFEHVAFYLIDWWIVDCLRSGMARVATQSHRRRDQRRHRATERRTTDRTTSNRFIRNSIVLNLLLCVCFCSSCRTTKQRILTKRKYVRCVFDVPVDADSIPSDALDLFWILCSNFWSLGENDQRHVGRAGGNARIPRNAREIRSPFVLFCLFVLFVFCNRHSSIRECAN